MAVANSMSPRFGGQSTRHIVTGALPSVSWQRFDRVSTLQDKLPWLIAVGFAGLLAIQAALIF